MTGLGKRVLAIDYGDKRTGLALSDPMGIIVQPLPHLVITGVDDLLEAITEIAQEKEVGKIVVGMPLRLDGQVGSRAQKTLKLIEQLKSRISVPVVEWDERLSSVEAEEILREAGVRWKQQKGKKDTLAAVLILRSYLQANS